MRALHVHKPTAVLWAPKLCVAHPLSPNIQRHTPQPPANSTHDEIRWCTCWQVDSPALGANYCVGCVEEVNSYTGGSTTGPWCCGASGSYAHTGTKDPIESLYEAQFDERTTTAPAQSAAQPATQPAADEPHAEEASGNGEDEDEDDHEDNEEDPEDSDAAGEEEQEDEDEEEPADDGSNDGKRAAAHLLSNHSATRFGRTERLLALEHGVIQPQPLS